MDGAGQKKFDLGKARVFSGWGEWSSHPLEGENAYAGSGRSLFTRSVAITVLGAFLLIACGFLIQRANLLPAAVPVIGKDTGVAACQVIADGKSTQGKLATRGSKMTEIEYRQARSVFEDSRYPKIRDNGTSLLDYAWQLQVMTASGGDPVAAVPLVQPLAQAYTGLAGGCADHGYTIPVLGS